jgi:hypothetical protein
MQGSSPDSEPNQLHQLPIEKNGADRPQERSLHPHFSQQAEGRRERGLSITDLAEVYGEKACIPRRKRLRLHSAPHRFRRPALNPFAARTYRAT